MEDEDETTEPATVVIVGAGIVGLVLALALKKHCGVTAELYEKASGFQDDIGAGIGMYPNGLRVIRHISPSLLNDIREAGHPYLYRRWMRHDGKEVTHAKEKTLCKKDDEIQSIGIRRWKLQKILFDAVMEEGISVEFGKPIETVTKRGDGLAAISFEDGTHRFAKIVFGADGSKSKVRESIYGKTTKLEYTGVTCLMGIANWARPSKGICFPSSCTTQCHACFFPTGKKEQCFQFHFPIDEADKRSWRPLSDEEGKEECRKLAEVLRQDGWDESFLEPLQNVANVVRIGFCLLKPRLVKWVDGPIILIGDAAHPPVPYIGQGAQMGIEDAGVVSQVLKALCVDDDGCFDGKPWSNNFRQAMNIYETLRIPRTNDILENSITLGEKQQKRATSKAYNVVRESSLRFQVFFHGTLPIMFPGATYDFKEEVSKAVGELRNSSFGRSKSTPSLRETTKNLIRRQAALTAMTKSKVSLEKLDPSWQTVPREAEALEEPTASALSTTRIGRFGKVEHSWRSAPKNIGRGYAPITEAGAPDASTKEETKSKRGLPEQADRTWQSVPKEIGRGSVARIEAETLEDLSTSVVTTRKRGRFGMAEHSWQSVPKDIDRGYAARAETEASNPLIIPIIRDGRIPFSERIEELEQSWGVPTVSRRGYKERIEALEIVVFGKINDGGGCMEERMSALE